VEQPQPQAPPSKLQQLEQVRAAFVKLAAGERKSALAAAHQLTDESEREAALLTLATAWRQGELRPPRQRAAAIAAFGLEAGLGMEFAGDRTLGLLWANELTEGKSRVALLNAIAVEELNSNPEAAMTLADHVSADERRPFIDSVLTAWASKDTEAALAWAQHVFDPGERDSAMQAIRQVAPVGIGTAISLQDGQPVIGELFPGSPAALSGQIRPGDRIVGVAQGDNRFVPTGGLSLQELVQSIRGAPGTVVQLQVVPGAAPDSVPRTVAIVRDQIKYKR